MTVKELRDYINSIDTKHDHLEISIEYNKSHVTDNDWNPITGEYEYNEDIGTITDTYNDDDSISLVVGFK